MKNELNQIDEHLVHELDLWAQNTESIYTSTHIPFVKNYRKKIQKGIYNEELGLRGILNNYVPRVVKSYNDEFGENTVRPTKADKIALAKELLQNVLDDVKEGVE